MKVSLILEALNKASKPIRAMMKDMAGAHTASQKGAAKAAKAAEKQAKAHDAAGSSAQKAANETVGAYAKAINAADTLEKKLKHSTQAGEQFGATMAKGILQAGAGIKQVAAETWRAGKIATALGAGAGVGGAMAAQLSSKIIAPMKDMEQLEFKLNRIERMQSKGTLSAAGAQGKARSGMAWAAGQDVNFSTTKATDAYVSLRDAGIAPTEKSFRTLGDAAAATQKSITDSAAAVAASVKGDMGALDEFGIKAEQIGKYIRYSFTDSDGKEKAFRALAKNKQAQDQAIQRIFERKYGGAMKDQANTWNGMVTDMDKTWEQFQLSIGRAGLFDWMKDKLGEIRNNIRQWEQDGSLKYWAQEISSALVTGMTIAWKVITGVIEGVKWLNIQLKYLDQNVISFQNMGYVLLALPFLPALLGIASGMISVTLGIGKLLWGFGSLIALLAKIGAFSKLGAIFRLLVAPIGLAARAFVSLGVAMITTPIGWIIAGIAAVAAAAYLIYRNWDQIGPYFWRLWDGVKEACSAAWEGIKTAISTAWEGVKALFGWTPLGLLINNWDAVTGFFGTWGDKALEAVKAAFKTIEDWVGGAVTRISDTFKKISDGVAAAWSYVFGGKGDTAQKTLEQGLTADPAQLAAVEAATAGIKTNMEGIAGANTAAALAQVGGLSEDAAKASEAIGKLVGSASASVQGVKSYLSSVNLSSYGVAFMSTLASGIRAGAGQAVAAVRETTQAMRDHLPHSPAKVGPLSDLHRVKFSETLASAIKPGPAIAAVRSMAAGMAAALPLSLAAPAIGAPLSDGFPAGAGGGGGAPVTISYAPTVTIEGGGTDAEAKFSSMLREHADEINRIVEQALRNRERVSY